MEDKKRLLFFLFLNFSFFALKHTPMESAVDEVRSCRCTFGSRQMGGHERLMTSCTDRILEGHNHDLIVLKLIQLKSRSKLPRRNDPPAQSFVFLECMSG